MTKTIPKPYVHQIDAFNFIKDKNSFSLFMEQGTGKSKVVVMKAEYLYFANQIDRMLIICPNGIKYQWAGEVLEKHCSIEFVSMVWDNFTTRKKKNEFFSMLKRPCFKVFVVNYDAFQSKKITQFIRDFLQSEKDTLIVCDESTKIKTPTAIRTKKIVKGFSLKKFKGILSGTPTPNSPFDLYSQFEFLIKGFWKTSFFLFKHNFAIMINMVNQHTGANFKTPLDQKTFNIIKWNLKKYENLNYDIFRQLGYKFNLEPKDIMIINTMKEYTPYKNIEQLKKKINPYTFYCKKEECLDLPDKVYTTLECDLSSEQKRLYKELKKDLMTEFEGRVLTITNAISITQRLQMITSGLFPFKKEINSNFESVYLKNNPKLDILMEDLETVSKSTSIIIWSIFTKELENVYSTIIKAGYTARLYYGKTPKNERKEIEEGFKNKDFQILVINSAVGEFGLNFQVSTLHYYISNSFKADTRLQSEDRSHRIGQKNKVTYKDIICRNSIDQKILKALKFKEDLIKYFQNKQIKDVMEDL